ncbi:type ISP restriction/modification enzyme [Candidatus Poribacteria bacterium]
MSAILRHVVEKVRYVKQDQRVYINSEQYFQGAPPEVWEFRVGGYQVCEKWLKDRKSRQLSYDRPESLSAGCGGSERNYSADGGY